MFIVSIGIMGVVDLSGANQLKKGTIVGSGRAPAIVTVWEEKADNSKGRLIVPERWIQRDEKIEVETERERIIYDYKYRSDDSWKTDNHAWCQTGNLTKIP